MTEVKASSGASTWRKRANASTPYSAQFGYIPGLDGLRLIAVAIVVARHFDISQLVPGGFGVSIFFFISGFLISRLLLAEEKRYGSIGLKAFYIRRFIRLAPPLILMGAVTLPVMMILEPEDFALGRVIFSFVYLGNLSELAVIFWGWPTGWGELGPLWSLAVEEHFYLLIPPILVFVRGYRARLIVVASLLVVPLLLRLVVFWQLDPTSADPVNYLSTPMRLDSLAWGVLLTLILDGGRARVTAEASLQHVLLWGGCLAMIVTLIHWSPLYEVALKYTPQSVAIGCTVFAVVFARQYKWIRVILELPLLRHLGVISYEIYLWHALAFTVVTRHLGSGIMSAVISLFISIFVAEVAYRVTTKRLRNFRRRFGGHPVS